jgi:hypothetical protein
MASDIDALLSDAATIEYLRAANTRLSAKLVKEQIRTQEMVSAVRETAGDIISGIKVPPIAAPPKDKRKRTPETAIAVLSDWQIGKLTPDYDHNVCAERIKLYAEKVARITKIQQADHPVQSLRVYLLGDLVEGEDIFEGQSFRLSESLFRQVLIDGPQILAGFLRSMLPIFTDITVVGVIGNHGSIGGLRRKSYHPETNSDAMMYEITRQLLAGEKRIAWHPNFTPNERKWYAVDYIGSKGYLLWHGDQVKGGMLGYPWYSFGKKIQGWANHGLPEPFDYSFAGHFHVPARFNVNMLTHWNNGTTESSNTYAQENMAAAGRPCQWLLFAHPDHGITAEHLIHLDDRS